MGDKSSIQWTDATWNPTTGCDRVSPGCANCYALTLAPRLQKMAVASGKHAGPADPYMRDGDPKTSGPGFGLMMHAPKLDIPLKWKRPRPIFVNSMSDLFHPEVDDEFIDRVFAVMMLAPQHIFQVLTKRPERMRAYLAAGRKDSIAAAAEQLRAEGGTFGLAFRAMVKRSLDEGIVPKWPLPNVWLGTSVENARWRTRIDELRATPAAVRFLSCEPLLGPLASATETFVIDDDKDSIDRIPDVLDLTGIDWVIIGGESGAGARPMQTQWVRDIVAECRAQGAKPFVKQMGEVWSREVLGHSGHAGDIERFPVDLQVREMPA